MVYVFKDDRVSGQEKRRNKIQRNKRGICKRIPSTGVMQNAGRQDKTLSTKRIAAYQSIAKHIFEAHPLYGEPAGCRTVIILADNIEKAKEKAQKVFGLRSVAVNLVSNTDDPQIYDI